MKKNIFIAVLLCLLAANVSFAGNVKFDIDFNAVKERMMKDATDIVGGALLFGTLFW